MIESFKLGFGFGFANPCIHYKGQEQHTSSVLKCNNLGGNWLNFFGGPPRAQFGHIIIIYYVKVKIVGPI
jgi:hypothetical protein